MWFSFGKFAFAASAQIRCIKQACNACGSLDVYFMYGTNDVDEKKGAMRLHTKSHEHANRTVPCHGSHGWRRAFGECMTELKWERVLFITSSEATKARPIQFQKNVSHGMSCRELKWYNVIRSTLNVSSVQLSSVRRNWQATESPSPQTKKISIVFFF